MSGIARAARAGARLVAARITAMKPAVATTSMISAPMSVIPGKDRRSGERDPASPPELFS
ncbi:MAG: hypothetical protein MUQ32_10020 [Chloroflexi bacterium]|nr:hypothetical protein [Chloroflexota bacterium]